LREERRKVERIIEALPKPTLKKKDDGPKETASETDKLKVSCDSTCYNPIYT